MKEIEDSLAQLIIPEPEIEAEIEAEALAPELVAGEGLPAPIAETGLAMPTEITPTAEVTPEMPSVEVPAIEALAEQTPVEVEETTIAVVPQETLAVPGSGEEVTEVSQFEAGEEELPASLDEIFALRPEVFNLVDAIGEDDEEDEDSESKQKKKKKKKFVEMEYDPDSDVMVVKKKHKRDGEIWDDNW